MPNKMANWKRTLNFIVSILVMVSLGTPASFPAFSTEFGTKMGWDLAAINMIASWANTSLYAGCLVAGPIFHRFRIHVTMIVAAVLTALGNFLIWLAFAKGISDNVMLIAFWHFVAGTGTMVAYMTCIGVHMTNFPHKGGFLLGILLVINGISPTIYSQIYTTCFTGKLSDFLLLMGIAPTVAILIGVALMAEVPSICATESSQKIEKTILPKPSNETLVDPGSKNRLAMRSMIIAETPVTAADTADPRKSDDTSEFEVTSFRSSIITAVNGT
ncbi:hypothetical protein HK102_003188, partial [Quaeritorhiza haematococci]